MRTGEDQARLRARIAMQLLAYSADLVQPFRDKGCHVVVLALCSRFATCFAMTRHSHGLQTCGRAVSRQEEV